MRITIPKVLLSLSLALCAGLSLAAEREAIVVADLGPQIGDTVPNFELPDQFGRIQTLDSVKGTNGTMLLFHRSADW
jgi:hypothetical protein